MDPPMPVQLDAGAPKAEPSSGRDHERRSKEDRHKETHKKSHKHGEKEKSRRHDRKHHKSKSSRKHRKDEEKSSPVPGALESGEIDLPDASAEVASAVSKPRLCTSAAEAINAGTTDNTVSQNKSECNKHDKHVNASSAIETSNRQVSAVAHDVTINVPRLENDTDVDLASRHEQSKNGEHHGNGARPRDDRKACQDPHHPGLGRHDSAKAAMPDHTTGDTRRDRSRHKVAEPSSREHGATRPADTAREARDRRMIERIGSERWDGEQAPDRHRSQSRHHEIDRGRGHLDRNTGRERVTQERSGRSGSRGDSRADVRGHRGDYARDGCRDDPHRGRSGGMHVHSSRDGDAGRSRAWERERDRDRGSAYGARRDALDTRRGSRAVAADLRGGERGAPRGAGERGAPRKRTRSVSPRTKAGRPRRHEPGRKDAEQDGGDALAAFEDMMTEEEREAKELEERRRRRAELEAKLSAGGVAATAAAAPAEGVGQRGTRSPDAGSPHNGQHASDPGAALGGTDSGGQGAADAEAEPASVAGEGEGAVEAQGRVTDGDDIVSMGSDAEEQQMEDLFRAAKQDGAPPDPAAANGVADDDDDDGDLFAEDDDADAGVVDVAMDGAVEAPVHDDRRDARQAEGFRKANTGLSDMYDDSQGYYNFRVGELMGGRYEVIKASGKGVFSNVVTAIDKLRQNSEGVNPLVAIKVIRANDTMYKAGKLELQILTKLAEADPENRRHVIRLLRSFEYRHHLCMVFEHMEMNLRELTRKVGVGRGIRIDAVGQLALQMLLALKHLRSNDVLHADIKPDNILINARMNKIKLCDLGSATFRGSHNEPTPYLVSRFYRSPEVILGLPYDFPMDMWSIACTIYELFTADILFKGRNNNEMLKLIMHLKGPLPKRMIRKGLFANQHFADDSSLSFVASETDVVSKEPVKRLVSHFPPGKGFLSLLLRVSSKEFQGNIPRDERRKLEMFATFLDKATELDPAKRLTPEAAMKDKFIETAKQQITMQYNAHRSKAK